MNCCSRHLPLMFVERLYLEFYNYMCVNGFVKMYVYALDVVFYANKRLYLF